MFDFNKNQRSRSQIMTSLWNDGCDYGEKEGVKKAHLKMLLNMAEDADVQEINTWISKLQNVVKQLSQAKLKACLCGYQEHCNLCDDKAPSHGASVPKPSNIQ